MDPIVRHRYVAGLVAAGALFIIGTIVVVSRSAISPANSGSGLNINGVIQSVNPSAQIPSAPEPTRPTAVDVPYTKITTSNAETSKTPSEDPINWDAFMTNLSHRSSAGVSVDATISDAYAFVPSGLISIEEPQKLNTLTREQKDLYEWGNLIGASIQSYENLHPNQVAILTDHMQDRQDAGKIAGMKNLGADLQAVGNSIETLGSPPAQLSAAALGLANAYREIGRNLATIPDAKGDKALVEAILTYNKSAEAFVQKYVSVALILQANGIRYTQDEPGGVFMFPSN